MILPWKSCIFSINQSLKKNWKDFDGVQQVWWCMSFFKAPRFRNGLDFGHVKIHKNRHSSYLESFKIQMKISQRDGSHGRQKFNVGLRVIYSRNRFSTVSVAHLESIMPDAVSGGPWSPMHKNLNERIQEWDDGNFSRTKSKYSETSALLYFRFGCWVDSSSVFALYYQENYQTLHL